jgi:GT2 family glycosyltransferase
VLTSIVIATYNKLEFTQQCIQSIRSYTKPGSYEIVIVDNQSTDGTVEWLQQQADIKAIYNKQNYGFPKACNQGIEVSKGDSILLLNNDTIVTENWLTNLVTCLHSSPEIGAVGAVTNNCSYGQTIPVSYQTIEEMQAFALSYNNSNQELWEERLKLIGYCMLIKKSVIDVIGLLDEQFTPGNYEDDDYSLRIRLAGNRLILCKDTFIHHFGSVSFREAPPEYMKLMQNNRYKYLEKWGYDPDRGNQFRHDFSDSINKMKDSVFRVLDISCGCGGNLLQIRNKYPQAELTGIEENVNAAHVAQIIAAVQVGNLSNVMDNLPMNYYDVILFSLSQEISIENGLTAVRQLLRENGQVITIIPNIMYFDRLKQRILGVNRSIQSDGLTYQETEQLFQQSGFSKLSITGLIPPITEKDKNFIQTIANAVELETTSSYEIVEFLVVAFSKDEALEGQAIKTLINQILTQTNLEVSLRELALKDPDEVGNLVANANNGEEEALMNNLAVQLLEIGESKVALKYLQQAYEWNQSNVYTLFNLGVTMYTLDEPELALEWFEMLPEKNEQVQTWMASIKKELNSYNDLRRQRIYLLRRIEYDLEPQNSVAELKHLLQNQIITVEDLLKDVTTEIRNQTKVIGVLADTGLMISVK